MKRSDRYECLNIESNLRSHHSLLPILLRCHRCIQWCYDLETTAQILFMAQDDEEVRCFACLFICSYICYMVTLELLLETHCWCISDYLFCLVCDCSKLQCLPLSSMKRPVTLRYVCSCVVWNRLRLLGLIILCVRYSVKFSVYIFLINKCVYRFKVLITAYCRSSWNPRFVTLLFSSMLPLWI